MVNCPINRVSSGETGVTSSDSTTDCGPGVLEDFTVKIKDTFSEGDDLVTEIGKSLGQLVTVESNSDLVGDGLVPGTDLESTLSDDNVAGVESEVGVVDDQSTLNDNGVQNGGRDVEKNVLSGRNQN